jgi:hypothetical protein
MIEQVFILLFSHGCAKIGTILSFSDLNL